MERDWIARITETAMTGTMSADRRFNSQVGSGSRGDDFAGVVRRMVRTSFSAAGWNDDRNGTDLSMMTGGGAAAVNARLLFTLLWKKSAKLLWIVSAGFYFFRSVLCELRLEQTTLVSELFTPRRPSLISAVNS